MKSRVTADQEIRQLNVKLAPEDSEFVQDVLRPQLGLPYNAEAVRELIARLRTWFYLPAPVVHTLEQDAELHMSTSWRTYRCSFTSATSRSPHTAPSYRGSPRWSCSNE
jgi:hypothetical protein